ncbi:prostaglandin reductase 1-like [Adelges cooleyi]|uniref:prostaglandin reductase 1-like n=1 Tax=Adelges cooleyi TaxID=133065 RepID=UPI00217FF0F3|nr:prostaglandin reductase 1-like [Adelges cooleyi]
MVKAKKFILDKSFAGAPKEDNFKLVEEQLGELKKGEILVEAIWISVDPYIRPYSNHVPAGTTVMGSQIAKVISSNNENFAEGQLVFCSTGWKTHSIINPSLLEKDIMPRFYALPNFGNLSSSLGLGVLGMPGNTALFGFLNICDPKPGETVVISAAAGAVGSHVGQIAKDLGCYVIGFAGSDDKVKWLKETLKFDAAFNYKTKDVTAALLEAAPQGVDCYFDNVGGEFSSAVIYRMNNSGRVSVCGSISSYNANTKELPKVPMLQPAIVFKQLKIEGFIVSRWGDKWMSGIERNLNLIKEGKLIYPEHITAGFENLPQAFMGMLKGENIGKALVKV